MKITIITAFIFPEMTPRANRSTELAIELARTGHEVTLYAILGNYDYSSFEMEHSLKVRDFPKMRFVKKTSSSNERRGLKDRILRKLFGRLLEFPTIELSFRVQSILKKTKGADLLITVCGSYPINWGTAWFKVKNTTLFPKIWIADCGDPYMGNIFNNPPFYFKYVEKWFCRKVDYLTVPIENAKNGYYQEFWDKIKVIPQGFRFNKPKTNLAVINSSPTFVYAGAFYPDLRDPRVLLEYLASLEIDFKFIIYTGAINLVEPYMDRLQGKIELRDYIMRDELIDVMASVDFLLNLENETSVQNPSKLIDYALAERPILSIRSSTFNHITVDEFLMGNYKNQLEIENLEQYNIRNVAQQFVELYSIDKVK
ncbi:hypothetical protein [Nonlabens sp. Hel1_33_55]|uniref:hypothetical protein n=1 Tax=Nonlabens sp. Hel1_33_55 TaxID=1336802 RepID=UPI0012FD4BF4|nr:hypothetical protein [Nonlabens sp. Hel1_33_55]